MNRIPAPGRPACADAPFRFSNTPGHLPKTVVPLGYVLTMEPHPETLTLTGTERVTRFHLLSRSRLDAQAAALGATAAR